MSPRRGMPKIAKRLAKKRRKQNSVFTALTSPVLCRLHSSDAHLAGMLGDQSASTLATSVELVMEAFAAMQVTRDMPGTPRATAVPPRLRARRMLEVVPNSCRRFAYVHVSIYDYPALARAPLRAAATRVSSLLHCLCERRCPKLAARRSHGCGRTQRLTASATSAPIAS